MVQAAIPCEVITLRSELHRLPTYAVNSPVSKLVRPRPPAEIGTWGQSNPCAQKSRRMRLGIFARESHSRALSLTSTSTVLHASFKDSGIMMLSRVEISNVPCDIPCESWQFADLDLR